MTRPRIGHEYNPVSLTDGDYTSKWSLTDLYPEAEEKLRELLASGQDFYTDWCGARKEIRYAQYEAEGNKLTVTVEVHMDRLYDEDATLVYDAAWAAGIPEDWEIPEDMIDAVVEACSDSEIDDFTEVECCLPRTASYEEVMEAVGKLEDVAETMNEAVFKRIQNIVLHFYEEYKN